MQNSILMSSILQRDKSWQKPSQGKEAVDDVAMAASDAFPAWRRTPVQERVQYLFKLHDLLKANHDEIARMITYESGKTFEEAKAEMVRAIENVEVACGMSHLMKGEVVEDIAPGIDGLMIRQPMSVCATVAPFNFLGMIAFQYLPVDGILEYTAMGRC